MEGILTSKATRWHQARAEQLADLGLADTWNAYWHAADTQFRNEHEVMDCNQKMRDLRYRGGISDYLVTL